MDWLTDKLGQAALMIIGMAWQTGWSLVLGFFVSSLLQTLVSSDQMRRAFGRDGVKEIVKAAAFGAASSSCSYASAAIMRTLFKKGAALATSLAFLFASTNLVLELGVILWVLLGWQFMAAEWIGGLVLIAIMSVIVKITAPGKLVEAARHHEEDGRGHQHHSMMAHGKDLREKIADPHTRVLVAQNFTMEWSMLWKDLLAGFVIGGLLAAFVPDSFWKALFLSGHSAWVRVPLDALIGPLVAIVTFVCSIGNVPLAAVLWAGGASFGGVIAFIFADLIVITLLDAYRRYFGWRMAAYLAAMFYVTMVVAALIVDVGFSAFGAVPARAGNARATLTHFSLNYTFWLNLVFGALALWLFWLNRRHPMSHHHGDNSSARDAHHAHGHASENHAG